MLLFFEYYVILLLSIWPAVAIPLLCRRRAWTMGIIAFMCFRATHRVSHLGVNDISHSNLNR